MNRDTLLSEITDIETRISNIETPGAVLTEGDKIYLASLRNEKASLRQSLNSLVAIPPQGQIDNNQIYQVHEDRKRRWSGLNNVLDVNKKSQRQSDYKNSVGYSYCSWEQVKEFFPIEIGKCTPDVENNELEVRLQTLSDYLKYASECFGSIYEGQKAKRVHFIAPIIIIVCSMFNGGVEILTEEIIEGNNIHALGRFEFVLKRGIKRLCIVEAKKDDILQGRTQSLIGCESLCDIDRLETAYSIATNYLEWCFLRNDPNKITEEIMTISLHNNQPTIESLRAIANKIYYILA